MDICNLLGDTILIVAAHADDAEISMGGTIAKMLQAGKKVITTIYALSGPPYPPDIRVEEAKKGSEILGADLNIPCRECRQVEDVPMYQIVRDIDSLINQYAPSTVFTHWMGDTHFDHRLLAEATISSSRHQRFNLLHFEQSSPRPAPLEIFRPVLYIDISDFVHMKWSAIRVYQSQKSVIDGLEEYSLRAAYHGAACKASYAEAFAISRLLG